MKKFLVVFLVIGLLFGGAMNVFANGKGNGAAQNSSTEVVDGRNGNSDKNGSFDLVISDGPYYVGATATVSVENLEIDGPIDTLVVSGAGEVNLQSNQGEQKIEVIATTYFKNGQKAGLIHTQITRDITIYVEERPANDLPVATSLSSKWNGEPNENNTVRVDYIINIGQTTIEHHTNFNHKDREAESKVVEKDGYTFIVEYLAP